MIFALRLADHPSEIMSKGEVVYETIADSFAEVIAAQVKNRHGDEFGVGSGNGQRGQARCLPGYFDNVVALYRQSVKAVRAPVSVVPIE